MRQVAYLSFYVLLNIVLAKGQTYTSVIETSSGPVKGFISTTIEDKDYAAFKGIPYAKPPIGSLRFKPPVPIDRWSNVHDATTEGNMCTQVSLRGSDVLGSEDCLYMNIYTPHTNFDQSHSKPVMVWIYGGAYSLGDSGQSTYGPDFLLGEDVIFVSFNYRLGALGFLNVEHENATGNAGLKDQNLALKWVKRNIMQFGGNPDKITIFGESAGSVSIDLHILSDLSIGLFKQSIAMSGSTLNLYWGFQKTSQAVKNGFKLGSKLGINTPRKDELLKTLHEASAVDIVTASKDIGFMPFRPTLENPNIAVDQEKFLTKCAPTKYKNGNYTKGPHMMGFTSDESLLFLGGSFDAAKSLFQSMKDSASKIPLLSGIIDSVINGIEHLTENATYGLAKKITDLLFILGIDTKQILMSSNNNYPIYYYRFSFKSNSSLHQAIGVNFDGAGHADELPYVFYMSGIKLPAGEPDIVITRQRMVKLLTNFAKYGNPTPNGENDKVLGVNWPDSRPNGVHLDVGKNLTTGPRPTNKFVKMLQFFKLGKSNYFNDCA